MRSFIIKILLIVSFLAFYINLFSNNLEDYNLQSNEKDKFNIHAGFFSAVKTYGIDSTFVFGMNGKFLYNNRIFICTGFNHLIGKDYSLLREKSGFSIDAGIGYNFGFLNGYNFFISSGWSRYYTYLVYGKPDIIIGSNSYIVETVGATTHINLLMINTGIALDFKSFRTNINRNNLRAGLKLSLKT